MESRESRYAREILSQHLTRYRLSEIGYIETYTQIIDLLLTGVSWSDYTTPEQIESKALELLLYYYSTTHPFAPFYRTQRDSPRLRTMLYERHRYWVNQLKRERPKSNLDSHFATPPHSLSYLPYGAKFDALFAEEGRSLHLFSTPMQMDKHYGEAMKGIYPNSDNEVLDRVAEENPHFVAIFYQRLCQMGVNYARRFNTRITPADGESLGTDLYLLLSKKLKNAEFRTKTINEIYGWSLITLRNMVNNLFRRMEKEGDILSWEEITDRQEHAMELDALVENESEITEDWVANIDAKDRQSRLYGLYILLTHPDHPLYTKLTAKHQERVADLIAVKMYGTSYQTLVTERFGNLAPEEMKRRCNSLTKEVSRTVEVLEKQFCKLLNEKKNGRK